MKKLLLAVVLCLGLAGMAQAEPLRLSDWVEKLPPMKNGIAYSFIEHDFKHIVTAELATWKGFAFEFGGAAEDKLVGVISYQLTSAEKLGIDLPILKYLEANLGLWAGLGRIDFSKEGNSEFDWGASLTLLTLKF